jgi:hypothetical protein
MRFSRKWVSRLPEAASFKRSADIDIEKVSSG